MPRILATWGYWADLFHFGQHSLVVSPPQVLFSSVQSWACWNKCANLAAPPGLRGGWACGLHPSSARLVPEKSRCLFCTSHSCCLKYLKCFGRLFACDGKRDGWFIASLLLKLKAILTIWGSFVALFSFVKLPGELILPFAGSYPWVEQVTNFISF